ncbi:MAG TPA: EVE domain-containing protein [Kiloniellales bacterium]|nr:EVE domain-containing protein [Kiloniellales bacterium]
MAYWLMKSEPETYSWQRLVKEGRTGWDGVRNNQAAQNLKAMKKGDKAFFYHSGDDKEIVGVMEVTKEAYPDPGDESGRFVMVDVKPLQPMPRPVTLAEVKAEKALADMLLVRHSRLSVSPVDEKAWKLIAKMGGLKG